MTKVDFHAVIMIIIIGFMYLLHIQNVRFNELSSQYSRTTVCHVYEKYNVKGATYYRYVYEVGDNYYTSAVGGVKVNSFFREPIQCFLLVFHKHRPSHHVILRNQKLKEIVELGTIVENPKNFKRLVEKNTTRLNTAVPKSKKNNLKQWMKYKNKTKK